MSIDQYGARLTRRDVTELAGASEKLAVAAATIRAIGPKWGESVVNNLIAANLVIERVQNKGAACFARYLEKRGLNRPVEAPAAVNPGGDANQVGESIPGKPEES
jgi:hypothetical protein